MCNFANFSGLDASRRARSARTDGAEKTDTTYGRRLESATKRELSAAIPSQKGKKLPAFREYSAERIQDAWGPTKCRAMRHIVGRKQTRNRKKNEIQASKPTAKRTKRKTNAPVSPALHTQQKTPYPPVTAESSELRAGEEIATRRRPDKNGRRRAARAPAGARGPPRISAGPHEPPPMAGFPL